MGLRVLLLLIMGVILNNQVIAQIPTSANDRSDGVYSPSRLIIGYEEELYQRGSTYPAAIAGIRVEREIPSLKIQILEIISGNDIEQVRLHLESLPGIKYVEYDYLVTAESGSNRLSGASGIYPDDPDYGNQWGLRSADPWCGIGATEAWDATTGDNDIVVAVIDAGLWIDHPDLENNVWINEYEDPKNELDDDLNGYINDIHGWDFVSNDNDPRSLHGHGTRVAGIIAAQGNNGLGIAGVTWNCKVMPLRTLDHFNNGWLSDHLEAIAYAIDKEVNIINASWKIDNFSYAMWEAIRLAQENNILFVCSAGNTLDNNDVVDHYPSNFEFGNIIAVAASTVSCGLWDQTTAGSNYGQETVDLAAPGLYIYSTNKPSMDHLSDAVTIWYDLGSPATEDNWIVDGAWTMLPAENGCEPEYNGTWDEGYENGFPSGENSTLTIAEPFSLNLMMGSFVSVCLWTSLPDCGYLHFEATADVADDNSWVTLQSLAESISTHEYYFNLERFDGEPQVWIRFRFESECSLSSGTGVKIDRIYIKAIRLINLNAYEYDGSEYMYDYGTSYAAPHVSGVAALLWSLYPSLDCSAIKSIILSSVDKDVALEPLMVSGGRLNAASAVSYCHFADLMHYEEDSYGDEFGNAVACAVDLNNNLATSMLVGAPWDETNGANAGKVYFYAPDYRMYVYQILGDQAGAQFGYSLASTNYINCNINDYIVVGAHRYDGDYVDGGRVYIYSYDNLLLNHTLDGTSTNEYRGYSVAIAGYVDGNIYPDIIDGAPSEYPGGSNPGKARVTDGTTGILIYEWTGETVDDLFGYAVASLGDINGDGRSDVIVGAPNYDNFRGKTYIYSGLTGAPISGYTDYNAPAGSRYGCAMASVGKIDNDDIPDYVVGAYRYDNYTGAVFIHSGVDGSLIDIIYGFAENYDFGCSVAGIGDVDVDGYDDIAVGARATSGGGYRAPGAVYIYSGINRELLYSIGGEGNGNAFGHSLAWAGNWEESCNSRLMIGAPYYYDVLKGKMYLAELMNVCEPQDCIFICGDFNGDEAINILDIVFLINYLYKSGPPPVHLGSADVNNDGQVNILDIVYLINYKYKSGPKPECP